MAEQLKPTFKLQLAFFSFTRIVVDTGHRMVYPFLPVIARGIGADLQTLALVLSIRQAIGLTAPVVGTAGDVWGRKRSILFGLGLFSMGLLPIVIWPGSASLLAGLIISALGKIMLDPAVMAYLVDRIPSTRRGMAIAIVEMGWSGASLAGVPILGWLIARFGWTAPFPFLAALAIAIALFFWRILPADVPGPTQKYGLIRSYGLIFNERDALASLVLTLILSISGATITIIYGVWFEASFHLSVAALGATSIVIGVAELGGESMVAFLSDRLGRRPTICLGLAVHILICIALPTIGLTLTGAIIGLFIFYLSHELAVVSVMPMMIDIMPEAKASIMAYRTAASRIGFAIGTLVGPLLLKMGLRANCTASAMLDLLGFVILIFFIRLDGDVLQKA